MIFYGLITIVFIAEIIIALFVLISLLKLHKLFDDLNDVVLMLNPRLKELMEIMRKISGQIVELVPYYAAKIKFLLSKSVYNYMIDIFCCLMLIRTQKHGK